MVRPERRVQRVDRKCLGMAVRSKNSCGVVVIPQQPAEPLSTAHRTSGFVLSDFPGWKQQHVALLCFSEIRSGSTRLQHQPAFRFGTPSLHGASVERCRSESTSVLEILGSLTQNARIGRGPPRRNGPYMNPHYCHSPQHPRAVQAARRS